MKNADILCGMHDLE